MSTGELPRAWGATLGTACIRTVPEDFLVDEELPFVPDGSGEHLLVQVEKRGHNTAWVAQRLTQFAGIHPRLVSFSGRKDRHAVTRQWFSLQLTARADPDWSQFSEDGIRILASQRHGRKLRSGTHRINRFAIILRDVAAAPDSIAARVRQIAAGGVPDYFGEQRFGNDNLGQAMAAVTSGRLPSRPEKRSLTISALRSAIFNDILAARVHDGSWNRILPGEPVMLDGTGGRWFVPETTDDPDVVARCAALDVHPGGWLAGTGALQTTGAVAELETGIAGRYDGVLDAFARWRVESGRRPLRSRVLELAHDWPEPGMLRLRFALWRGSYATAVLREVFDVEDVAVARRDATSETETD